jgi:GT2 family glycosyltransferase
MYRSTHKSTAAASPLISIIIPAYNYARYIGETLESVRAQTHQNWECIVVDDGSKDSTREVVAQYIRKDSRIRYIYQRNRGPAAARNKGLKNFRGHYVQFWDADDLVEPRKLELHIQYLEEHSEISLVYGNARYFRTEKPDERRYSMWEINAPWMAEVSGTGKEVLGALVSQNIMVISAPLLRRSVVESVGCFDNRLNPLEDWDYWIRCAASGKRIQYLDLESTLSLVRSHPSSINKDRMRAHRAELLLRRKIDRTLTDTEILAMNRKLLVGLEQTDRDAEIHGAVERIERGQWPKAMWEFIKIGGRSQSYREAVKWLFCAFVAPFAPKDNFQVVVTAPAGDSILKILRHHLRRSGRPRQKTS